jgi:hypothetical protein
MTWAVGTLPRIWAKVFTPIRVSLCVAANEATEKIRRKIVKAQNNFLDFMQASFNKRARFPIEIECNLLLPYQFLENCQVE